MRRQVVWRNYFQQITGKEISVKTCTESPKKERPPIYGNRCSFDQKRKVVHNNLLNNFSLCTKRCAITKKSKFLLMILQSLQFILFCVRKMMLHQVVVRMSKNCVFDNVVHFIDEENMVTYVDFDCGITFFPETPTKITQINQD